MALITPQLYSIAAFDATLSHMIYFTVSGGDQVVANRLLIKTNDNNLTTVYNQVVESYSFNHTIPANTLTNGEYYVAQIKTYGVNDDITSEESGSPWSSPVVFRCYTTPTLTWTNAPETSMIQESSFTFNFLYEQSEGEELYSYVINLYDNNKNLIHTSGIKYASGETAFSYKINGLIDDQTYYIKITGITLYNTEISSETLFFVNYYEPYSRQIFEAKNDSCDGWITITNNPIIIIHTSFPDPPIYTKNDTAIDLKNEKDYVKWTNFYQSGDFCVRIWGYSFNTNKKIFIYSKNDALYNLTLYRRDGYEYNSDILQTYYELQVQAENSQPYFIYSNYINQPSDTDKIFICIKRIEHLYSLYIENLE